MPRNGCSALPAAVARGGLRLTCGAAVEAAARTGDRSHLPPGDRATESLFRGVTAAAIRRIYLVRRDQGGNPDRRRGIEGPPGYLSIRSLRRLYAIRQYRQAGSGFGRGRDFGGGALLSLKGESPDKPRD